MTRRRRAFAAAAGLGLLAAAVLVLTDAPARYLVLEDGFDTVDAALVMAGDPNYERTTTAARLVLSGRARLLVLTGTGGSGDSSESLRAWAIHLGVKGYQIRTESESASTWSSMRAVEPILRAEGIQTVALVTSPYHQRRAYLTALRVFGPRVRVFNHPARPSFWSPRRFWATAGSRRIVVSEYAKLVYYAFQGWI